MPPISYARHRFPPEVIRHAVWLYLRFPLSYRDAGGLLAERRLEVSLRAGPVPVTKPVNTRPPAPPTGAVLHGSEVRAH